MTLPQRPARDHGGGLDAAAARHGGPRAAWLDLSTGINPVPYPAKEVPPSCWTDLPDTAAMARLEAAARRVWQVPETARIIAAPGASALIARLPELTEAASVHIPGPTYNEHAAAFTLAGREVTEDHAAPARVLVHPNNPDGRLWTAADILPGAAALTVIDESFCDVCPQHSLVQHTARPGPLILKSFGKFWGLAGLRLGFAIAHPDTLRSVRGVDLTDLLGPWPVSGPALEIGASALEETGWAEATRARLAEDSARLDDLMQRAGARCVGGTPLFRLFDVGDAAAWQTGLAGGQVWTRRFPYSDRWLRLGLPAPDRWVQLQRALERLT